MKLVAMMIVHNEADRYLRPCLDSLLGFCDEIRVFDDGSTDEFREIGWHDDPRVVIERSSERTFFEHEGRARQELLRWAMEGSPTHLLAIDADEFVSDGPALRDRLEEGTRSGVVGLNMQEVWKADTASLSIRQDGGWREHPIGIAFQVPHDLQTPGRTNRQVARRFRIPDRALACGRVPLSVAVAANRSSHDPPACDILHFGWTCEADRESRYARYAKHDGGRYHRNTHLESIMWGDDQVELTTREWPVGMAPQKNIVLNRVARTEVN